MFGERFPYTNMHDLNLDWIVEQIKAFLNKYEAIETLISDGEDALTAKKTELEGLLQDWYDTHRANIVLQLANALSDFNTEVSTRVSSAIASIPADYTNLSADVQNLVDQFRFYDSSNLIQGGYNSDGSVNASGTNYLRPADLIPVYRGMAVYFRPGTTIDRVMIGWFDPVNHVHNASYDVAWFTEEKFVIIENTGFICPLFRRASNVAITPSQMDAEFILMSKEGYYDRQGMASSRVLQTGTVAVNAPLSVGYKTEPRKNLVIGFEGRVYTGTVPEFTIGLYNQTDGLLNKFVIGATAISATVNGTPTVQTENHGITIGKNVQVLIRTLLNNTVTVTVCSEGDSNTITFSAFQLWRGGVAYVTAGNNTIYDCKLSWSCSDVRKKVWIFGDSYTAYGSNRWPYYAGTWIDNVLLDGYGGESSSVAVKAFEDMLQIGKPDYAIISTGLNDTDDEDNTTPNSTWLNQMNKFINLCKLHEITPILCTVPTATGAGNHNGKTFWVRHCGYRFIDIALAVGADGLGNWYTGLLADDGIHPTPAGAEAIAREIPIEVPEVLIP